MSQSIYQGAHYVLQINHDRVGEADCVCTMVEAVRELFYARRQSIEGVRSYKIMKGSTILPMTDTAGRVGNQVDGIGATCHLMISKARLGGGNEPAIVMFINEK